jgi:hypothetical protein
MGAPYGGGIDGDHRVVELLDLQADAEAACGSDAGRQIAVITDRRCPCGANRVPGLCVWPTRD